MRYHPALDGAPSSASSTLIGLVSSFLSVLGCMFVLLRLHRLRGPGRRRWHTRHYLILMLTATNTVMALTALISGGFYLVFGRIALAAGCTIGGMIEFWAQQASAVDVCAVLMTLAALASLRRNAQWTRRQHWIQANMAPVVGLVIFLPLVSTVVSQIVWRFRSSEFAYCWIPRMPVHARWIAVDGWRMLVVAGIAYAYIYMALAVRQARRRCQCAAGISNDGFGGAACTEHAKSRVAAPHYSAIDSGLASNATNDARGLFSQSIHNAHYWALSKLGRSNVGGTALGGLRAKVDTAAVSAANGPMHPGATWAVGVAGAEGTQTPVPMVQTPAPAPPSTTRTPRSYYEQFKRSFVHNVVRWFTITTDIPSPTIPPSIFDTIGREGGHMAVASPSTVRCDFCSSGTDMVTAGRPSGDAWCSGRPGSSRSGGIRRWCSALARLMARSGPQDIGLGIARPPPVPMLRRSHTAPAMTRQAMGLCNCVFRRPPSSHHLDRAPCGENCLTTPSQQKTLAASWAQMPYSAYGTAVCRIEGMSSASEHSGVVFDATPKDASLLTVPDKIRALFGRSLAGTHESQPRHVSIYACANYTGSLGALCRASLVAGPPVLVSGDSGSSSLHTGLSGGAEKLSSLEEGRWGAAVASCRSARSAGQLSSVGGCRRVSRLYVYPLAYAAVWLPSLIYCVVSTYVYYNGFARPHHHAHSRRSVDMSGLPAHWTHGMNANHAWPFYRHATEGVAGSAQLYWLAIVQALHLLNGAVDAVLFWLTEGSW